MKAIVQFPNEPTFTVIGAINSTFRNGKYDNIGVEELGNTGLILTNIAAADYGTDTMDVRFVITNTVKSTLSIIMLLI